jgi:pyruvate dehydrogenase E2 component (dihydrolipoamide acetyltransferase)
MAAGGAGIEPVAVVDFSKFGEVETRALSRIKKISGPHLHRAWLNVPHVTHHDEADVTELEAFRGSLKDEAAKQGVRITALAFITKAVASTLGEFPSVNASLTPDGESLVYKKYFHVGIAMDTPNGLVVPVLRDVDKKGIFDLASEMAEISARAREGKLKPDEMQGGCFSISSLGGIGGTAFTPIVNAPEVAILGVTRARMSPLWNGKEFVPRLMLPLDLSYDHRVIDGAEAARFMAHLCGLLGDLRRLIL